MLKLLLSATLAAVVACQYSVMPIYGNTTNTFNNPILESGGADPWVFRHGDYYYMVSQHLHQTSETTTNLLFVDLLQQREQCVKFILGSK